MFRNGHWHSNSKGGALRRGVFPPPGVYPRLSGLGVLAQFGIGGGNLTATAPGLPPAEGTQSFGGVGALYEWSFLHVLGGHFAAGPSLEDDAVWSLPFERPGLVSRGRPA